MPCSLYETIRSNICIQSTSKPKYPEAPLTQNSSALSLVLPAITDNVYLCLDGVADRRVVCLAVIY